MLSKTLFVLLFGSIIACKTFATTFQPIPLEKLIEESGSAAEVELKEKKSYMNKMGMIFTDYKFIVNESYALENSDLDGEFLKITMIGGTVNGVTSYIDSAPEFAVGEKAFLLLKKVESKIYLSNFTMGKYKIQEQDGATYYVSSVFPYDKDLGKVKKDRMLDLVKLKFKITESVVPAKKSIIVEPKKEVSFNKNEKVFDKREPAQVSDAEASADGVFAMWGFFALMVTTGFTIWWKLKKGMSA